MAGPPTSPKKAGGSGGGLAGAVKVVVRAFLEQKHYRQLTSILGEQWGNCHSLTAAVRLMEAHGVKINAEEEKRLSQLPEERMIDALVMRMPQQSREQFEHFFLQLSLIASTTTRLRTALESGNSQAIEEVMDAAENVGILQYILKMAVAQAGQEAANQDKMHDAWCADTDAKMGPLLKSQKTSVSSKKALARAKSELGLSHSEANEKSKKVLMGLAGGQDSALISSCFMSWSEHCKRIKKEAEIGAEYAEEIRAAEDRLAQYIDKQIGTIRGMLFRKAGESDMQLVEACFQALIGEVREAKFRKSTAEEAQLLDGKLKTLCDAQATKSKKVLARMNAGTDEGLKHMMYTAWLQHSADYKKDKEINDQVKASEQKLKEFMEKRGGSAKSVISKMTNASDSALVSTSFMGWVEIYTDSKKEHELKVILEASEGRFKSFGVRNKATAGNCMERGAQLAEQGVLITVFNYWKKETRVERMRRYGKERNNKKKQQLVGVKGLFRNFASELESGLKDGTPRVDQAGQIIQGSVPGSGTGTAQGAGAGGAPGGTKAPVAPAKRGAKA